MYSVLNQNDHLSYLDGLQSSFQLFLQHVALRHRHRLQRISAASTHHQVHTYKTHIQCMIFHVVKTLRINDIKYDKHT